MTGLTLDTLVGGDHRGEGNFPGTYSQPKILSHYLTFTLSFGGFVFRLSDNGLALLTNKSLLFSVQLKVNVTLTHQQQTRTSRKKAGPIWT